jgi:mannosyltransferase OCH1-like enzyme
MRIPRIVHQLWKNETVPARWRRAQESVKRYHKGWEYRLWTDELMHRHVRTHHPEFYSAFAGFNRPIMRVDVFRYVLMHDIGGMYCDLDYEFVRPFAYGDAALVLSLEYDEAYGDHTDQVANYLFASVPGHRLWVDVLAHLRTHPPYAARSEDVCSATGPWFLTGVFLQNRSRYDGVLLTPKPVFSPRRVHGRYERKFYINSGITHGFHHGWGSWRDRLSWTYLRHRIAKWVGRLAPAGRESRASVALWSDTSAVPTREARSRIVTDRE